MQLHACLRAKRMLFHNNPTAIRKAQVLEARDAVLREFKFGEIGLERLLGPYTDERICDTMQRSFFDGAPPPGATAEWIGASRGNLGFRCAYCSAGAEDVTSKQGHLNGWAVHLSSKKHAAAVHSLVGQPALRPIKTVPRESASASANGHASVHTRKRGNPSNPSSQSLMTIQNNQKARKKPRPTKPTMISVAKDIVKQGCFTTGIPQNKLPEVSAIAELVVGAIVGHHAEKLPIPEGATDAVRTLVNNVNEWSAGGSTVQSKRLQRSITVSTCPSKRGRGVVQRTRNASPTHGSRRSTTQTWWAFRLGWTREKTPSCSMTSLLRTLFAWCTDDTASWW